jgi:hypothetical protein
MRNYKNVLFPILAFFLISLKGYGQSNKLDIQVEGGPSLISIQSRVYNPKATLNGFTGGLYLNYNFNKRLSIKSGIAYERKGFRDSFAGTTAIGQSSIYEMGYNLDYLVVPLLMRANFGNKIRFFVNGGPYLGYLVKQQDVSNLPNFPMLTDANFTEKKIDLGISAGVGCSYPINELISITVEARNNLALISLNDGVNSNNNNSTNFNLGITYHLRDK